jgi:hypothetical protein
MADQPLVKIDLGGLSEAAKALIEKISDGIGGIFKPGQIVRVAKAEAEVDRIRAESQIEVTELHRRALRRFLEEEANKQLNIEAITQKALPQLKEDSSPQDVDDDWIKNFFDKCRIASDEEMQSLWARVLAGEANSPGMYSKRTVNFLGSLDKEEASLFTSLCGFGWFINEVTVLIFDHKHKIYNDQGINFDTLSHFDDIGLVSFKNIETFIRKGFPKRITVFY